jgi:hypothetical protein
LPRRVGPAHLSLFAGRPFHRCQLQRMRRPAITHTLPIRSVITQLHPTREAGIRPCVRTVGHAMTHGVVMNVLNMPAQIVLVANGMLPEPPLPYATFPVPSARLGDGPFVGASFQPTLREASLDTRPTRGEVGIPDRKTPYGMQMIREQDNRKNVEGQGCSHFLEGVAQTGAGGFLAQERSALMRHHGEEECAARLKGTTVFGHEVMVSEGGRLCQAGKVGTAHPTGLSRRKGGHGPPYRALYRAPIAGTPRRAWIVPRAGAVRAYQTGRFV